MVKYASEVKCPDIGRFWSSVQCLKESTLENKPCSLLSHFEVGLNYQLVLVVTQGFWKTSQAFWKTSKMILKVKRRGNITHKIAAT